MRPWQHTLQDALRAGKIVGTATAIATVICGVLENGNAVAPINAISHIMWGDEALEAEAVSVRYTVTALALNDLAGVGWAAAPKADS